MTLLCPSAPCEPGAVLLGVVNPDATVGYVWPRVEVDEGFVAAAGERPERRLRFAQPCAEGRCASWTGEGCGVVRHVLGTEAGGEAAAAGGRVSACAIRGDCRWHAQEGLAACRACPLVITDAG